MTSRWLPSLLQETLSQHNTWLQRQVDWLQQETSMRCAHEEQLMQEVRSLREDFFKLSTTDHPA